LIVYSIAEISVANYTVNITSDGKGNWTVNNTHVPELVNVSVVKVWDDNENSDNVRPNSIHVELYANGIKLYECTLNSDNGWKYSFDNLSKYNNGSLINYSVKEEEIANYVMTITNDSYDFTIVNSHIRPDMTVRKISNNQSVEVGQQVSFTIVVKNTGNMDLTGVYVIDDDYTSGLVYDHFVDSTSKWIFEGNGKWTYSDILKVGQEAKFDVVFNTTSIGFKINNVTAGNNITNKTVNSTNTTKVVNKTKPVPPSPEPPSPVPPKEDVPHKSVESKEHVTGNPLLMLLFALIIPFVRTKRKN
ncbi:Cna B-type domain-containing protein, partial [Methanobrevibacter sp.]